ncbi:hypothetical protein ACFVMC_29720 [Nocardia sp. NPDC127579]|uniref:hypothetical protein n=1 Tax=Nocardia sp. NPDC127579 TaxID=3345402 RepID=UPI0036372BF6
MTSTIRSRAMSLPKNVWLAGQVSIVRNSWVCWPRWTPVAASYTSTVTLAG